MLTLLALQRNAAGSVLINNGTLGAEIRELKPGVVAQGLYGILLIYDKQIRLFWRPHLMMARQKRCSVNSLF